VRNKPAYSIESVDHALRLAAMLQQQGPLRVSEAAERLGVARSTAHRLLAMLVYRDFAEQDANRCYRAGPVLRSAGAGSHPAGLRELALPHLRALVARCGETVNLVVLVGAGARFVATVESANVLRVGDREGRTLPAHLASGGLALLAEQDDTELAARYVGDDQVDLDRLRRELRRVRRQGFAVNDQRTEVGVTAVGRAIHNETGVPVAALSIAMPTARYKRAMLPQWTDHLVHTSARIQRDLTPHPAQ
jgi:DNA-binding IclR family transcriptional regulator